MSQQPIVNTSENNELQAAISRKSRVISEKSLKQVLKQEELSGEGSARSSYFSYIEKFLAKILSSP